MKQILDSSKFTNLVTNVNRATMTVSYTHDLSSNNNFNIELRKPSSIKLRKKTAIAIVCALLFCIFLGMRYHTHNILVKNCSDLKDITFHDLNAKVPSPWRESITNRTQIQYNKYDRNQYIGQVKVCYLGENIEDQSLKSVYSQKIQTSEKDDNTEYIIE